MKTLVTLYGCPDWFESKFLQRTMKTLIILNGCADWFESKFLQRTMKTLFILYGCADWFESKILQADNEDTDHTVRMCRLIWVKVSSGGQWRHWSYCTDVQTDLSQSFFRRTMKTLIILYGCADWFESSFGAYVRRYVFSRCGSLYMFFGYWATL